MTNATRYTCQCPRCDGVGRYDRGTCFECKGFGYVNRATTRGLTPFVLSVTYANGSTNAPRVFASSRQKAIQIVERTLRIRGWEGVVA